MFTGLLLGKILPHLFFKYTKEMRNEAVLTKCHAINVKLIHVFLV